MTNDVKFYFGPVTKNVIEAVIEYSNETKETVGFIMSRRQIDYDGGYVGFNTNEFVKYIKSKTDNVIICRDHGGIGQGTQIDNGSLSFYNDGISEVDIIHIDPWKYYNDFECGVRETLDMINFIININPNVEFEVGTEESIKYMTPVLLDNFLSILKSELGNHFLKIKYAVIQSGTRLIGTKNTGEFSLGRLKKFIDVCNKYAVLSKEHNGDYLTKDEKNLRFNTGLNAINIAPELGVFETDLILKEISTKNQFDEIYDICFNSFKWKKWVNNDFDFNKDKEELIRICGHYVNDDIKSITNINDSYIIKKIKGYLNEQG